MAIVFTPWSIATKTTANSYITVERLEELAAVNVFIDNTKFNNLSLSDKQMYLMNATDIIENGAQLYSDSAGESYQYVGNKFDPLQRLEFPRNTTTEVIIYDIEILTAQLASMLIGNPNLFMTNAYQDTKVKQVGDLKLEYFEPKVLDGFITQVPTYTRNILQKYLVKVKDSVIPFSVSLFRA